MTQVHCNKDMHKFEFVKLKSYHNDFCVKGKLMFDPHRFD